ncbi:MAG: ArsR/SmtB family transcription factor [Acidimicrobiales bacterium]
MVDTADADDRLSVIFSALADPTRRAILARLTEGDATVGELAQPFDISLPAISRHLKVLERAGLISRGRSAQWRTSTLEAAPLKEATDWIERYRVFWDANLGRLDAHLKMVMSERAASAPGGSDPAPGTNDNVPGRTTRNTNRKSNRKGT